MSYPISYPKPTNANIQIFFGNSSSDYTYEWVKPQGCSFVWFTLIGCGGNGAPGNAGSASAGGGSGAVTNCLMPAFLVPDLLNVRVIDPRSGTSGATLVSYKTGPNNSFYTLLLAAAGGNGGSTTGGAGGAASTANGFSCAGLFQSIAGQAGNRGGYLTPSSTTFLSGGDAANGGNSPIDANYGYQTINQGGAGNGYFQISPIIVGVGGINSIVGVAAKGGIGCGGSGNAQTYTGSFGYGGPGAVFIISW